MLLVVAAWSLLGWLMTRWQMMPGTTALWGTSPGAASVMTIMAEHYGADIRLVAFMQYLRVVLVAAVAALVARLFGVSASPWPADIVWFPAGRLGAAGRDAGAGDRRARSSPAGCAFPPAPSWCRWCGASCSRISAWMTIELPTWLLAASYAFVGWNVGLRFTRPLLIHAVKALPRHLRLPR